MKFGIPQGVDFISASFVQNKEDVELIRKALDLRGRSIKIIPMSKLEAVEAAEVALAAAE